MPRIVLIHCDQRSGATGDRLRDSLAVMMPDVYCDKVDWSAPDPGQDSRIRQLLDGAAGTVLLVSAETTALESANETTDRTQAMGAVLDIALGKRIPVIPVLTLGMQLSDMTGLSGPFAELLQHAPIELRHVKWDDDVARIVDRIEWQLSDPNTVPYWRSSLDGVTAGRRSRWVRLGAHADQVRRRIIPRSRYWRRVSRALVTVFVVVVVLGGYRAYRLWDERFDRAVSRLATELSYTESVNTTTAAIQALQDVAQRARRPRVTDTVVLALSRFVLSGPRQNQDARLLRRRALEAVKRIRDNDLSSDFARGELRDSELFRADLSSARLHQVSFEDASLEGVRFTGADLTNANLSGAYVRNGDFSNATLLGADLTELDWYNARGVTEAQLRSAVQNGIRRCPSEEKTRAHSEAAFRANLTSEYNTRWDQFAEIDRSQLIQLWNEYARPGGVCERVDRW